MKRGLDTQLRHLAELLDWALAASYAEAVLGYRPRYTPVLRALALQEPRSIGDLAAAAGISQPAVTKTVALMLKEGLVARLRSGADGRQKLIGLSDRGRAMLPRLQQCWAATSAAEAGLDASLPHPLSSILEEAIAALEQQPFDERIRAAHMKTSIDTSACPATYADAQLLLRRHKVRPTLPRVATLVLLMNADRALNADLVHDALSRARAGVSRSSVYRALKELQTAGLLAQGREHAESGKIAYVCTPHAATLKSLRVTCKSCAQAVFIHDKFLVQQFNYHAAQLKFDKHLSDIEIRVTCNDCAT